MVAEELVTDSIQFVSGDPGFDVGTDLGECLSGEFAGGPHAFDRVGVLYFRSSRSLRAWLTHILGTRNMCRDRSHR